MSCEEKKISKIMNVYYQRCCPVTYAMKKQNEWRKRQIKTLYVQGRPIFGRFKEHS